MIYEGYYDIPMLQIEDDEVTWGWFRDKCIINKEIKLDDGFLILLTDLHSYYIGAYRSYIDFEFYDPDDLYLYDLYNEILGYIVSFVDKYIYTCDYMYLSSNT